MFALGQKRTTLPLCWFPFSAEDLSKVLGEDQIKALMTHSGLSRDELIAGLGQQLPELINQLTPNGRLPTEHEVSRLI